MKTTTQHTIIIYYTDGKIDQFERSFESPCQFIADGVLNVKGRQRVEDDFNWFYFPLCNVRYYKTITEEVTTGGAE